MERAGSQCAPERPELPERPEGPQNFHSSPHQVKYQPPVLKAVEAESHFVKARIMPLQLPTPRTLWCTGGERHVRVSMRFTTDADSNSQRVANVTNILHTHGALAILVSTKSTAWLPLLYSRLCQRCRPVVSWDGVRGWPTGEMRRLGRKHHWG